MSPPVNVIFDFGGVLVDWKPEEILARQFPDLQHRDLVRREVLGHPDWVALDRGVLSESEAVSRFARRTATSTTTIEALFDAVRDALKPKADTVRILRALAARGTPLYGLSNMSLECYQWLRAQHDFFDLFDAVVVSGAVRLVKPEPEIYRHLANTHHLTPSQCLFIDDMPPNVEAAQRCGFEAVQFTDASALEAELLRRGLEVG